MNYRFILPLILCAATTFLPQQARDAKISEGAEALYNFDFSSAEQCFDLVVKARPDDPIGYYYKAQISLWNFLGNGKQTELDAFTRVTETAIEKAKEAGQDKKREDRTDLLLGNLYTQRVIAYGKAGKYLDMIWASQKAHSHLSEVYRRNPFNYDAHLGLGLFKFFLSQVPSTFRWALNLIGYSGDVREGIALLRNAAFKGDFTKVESQFYYAQILSDYQRDYITSEKILRSLRQKYPDNMMISYALALTKMKAGEPKSAVAELKSLLSSKNERFPQLKSYAHFLLGEAYFKQNLFEKARPAFKAFLETSSEKNYTGSANLRLAYCAFALGAVGEIPARLSAAKKGNPSIDDDHHAAKQAAMLLQTQFTKEDIDAQRFSNFIESGDLKRAVDSLSAFIARTKNLTLSAAAHYHIAKAYMLMGNTRKAEEHAKNCIKIINPLPRNWLIPFSYLLLAESAFSRGESEAGKNHLRTAESFSDYEFPAKFKSETIFLKIRYNLL